VRDCARAVGPLQLALGVWTHAEALRNGHLHAAVDGHRLVEQQQREHRHNLIGFRAILNRYRSSTPGTTSVDERAPLIVKIIPATARRMGPPLYAHNCDAMRSK
jgi:hypothetical protein